MKWLLFAAFVIPTYIVGEVVVLDVTNNNRTKEFCFVTDDQYIYPYPKVIASIPQPKLQLYFAVLSKHSQWFPGLCRKDQVFNTSEYNVMKHNTTYLHRHNNPPHLQ